MIHKGRKHKNGASSLIIGQFDGNDTTNDVDDVDDELYKRTEDYWKRGTLGTGVSTVFQQFLDAIEVIDKSDLDEEEKKLEKDALIEAKKDRDRVKMAPNKNMSKARLDEHLGTPAPLQWRGRRGGGVRPHQ